MSKITLNHLKKHETKKGQLVRFLVTATVLIIYIIYLSLRFGSVGFSLGVITWSAFVMATPIADGGLILDFPVRLITNIRMIFSEMIVWCVAISANIYFLFTQKDIYQNTTITKAFYEILIHPWPNWIIVLFSLAGTFLSLYFADELLDIVFYEERKKYQKLRGIYQFVIGGFFVVLFYFLYKYFLELFGINI